ncbi:MAG: type III pantothenate kinase [Calditrichaeota bacterium]|nr:type III pantothenate kinase [Calditrichota bacterium]
MKDLLLTIDIGNTHTVLGFFRERKLVAHWRLTSSVNRTEDESWMMLRLFCESSHFRADEIAGVVISSVVPNLTPVFAQMTRNYMGIEPLVVSSALELPIQIAYQNPRAVGADRICDAVAGFHSYGGPLIIVDLGTATTFDVITENGEYLGGAIAPGIETSAIDLFRRAAKLFPVQFEFPERIIGRNTKESIQAGIMFGAVQQVDGIVKTIIDELNTDKKVHVVGTGGLAGVILNRSKTIEKVEPFLTLDGMRLIYENISA